MDDLAARVARVCYRPGPVTLSSGLVRGHLWDVTRRLIHDEQLRYLVGAQIMETTPIEMTLAGIETGGWDLALLAASMDGIDTLKILKHLNDEGMLIEGAYTLGQEVCLIDDVVTTGRSVLRAATELRMQGLTVTIVVCLIDREEGGREALAEAGLELRALWTEKELLPLVPDIESQRARHRGPGEG